MVCHIGTAYRGIYWCDSPSCSAVLFLDATFWHPSSRFALHGWSGLCRVQSPRPRPCSGSTCTPPDCSNKQELRGLLCGLHVCRTQRTTTLLPAVPFYSLLPVFLLRQHRTPTRRLLCRFDRLPRQDPSAKRPHSTATAPTRTNQLVGAHNAMCGAWSRASRTQLRWHCITVRGAPAISAACTRYCV